MSALKDFQSQHGPAWGAIVTSPAFAAALTVSHNEKLKEILAIHDDQIHDRSQVLLADLRGHLRLEAALIGLHEKKEFVFQELGPEEYADPVKEAYEEAEAAGLTRAEVDDRLPPGFVPPPEPRPKRQPNPKTRKKRR